MRKTKAVILAGGFGTRLRPLTYTTPKPLCRIMGESVIDRLLRLLFHAGINETIISTMYMPEAFNNIINSNNEMKISIICETTPLGSAGGVKYALLNSDTDDATDYIILSGDGIFDFDINNIISFHYNKNADVTIVSCPCQNPSEYGVILTDKDGKITSFSEKPSWSNIKSDMINTGIYVLKSDVINYIPDGRFFDISKDLFPFLMGIGKKLYSYESEGYWCDIGSLDAYYSCNIDALNGKIGKTIISDSMHPCIIYDDSLNEIQKYCIGKHANINHSAIVGANCIIEDAVVENGAIIEGSIILKGAHISENSVIINSIICENVIIGKNCRIASGCVIGANTILKDNIMLDEYTKILPNKTLERGSYLTGTPIFENNFCSAYGECGYDVGKCEAPVDNEFVSRLGYAIGNALTDTSKTGRSSKNIKVGVMHNGESKCALTAEMILCCLKSCGIQTFSYLNGFEAQALFLVNSTSNDLILFITEHNGKRGVKLLGNNSTEIEALERKIESCFRSRKNSIITDIKDIVYIDSINHWYYNMLSQIIKDIPCFNTNIYFYPTCGYNTPTSILKKLFSEYNFNIVDTPALDSISINLSDDGTDATIEQTLGDKTCYLDLYHIKSALIVYERDLHRYKSSQTSFDFYEKSDMLFSICNIIYILAYKNITLLELYESLPSFEIFVNEIEAEEFEIDKRAYIMKKLYENHRNSTNNSCKEGINLIFDTGNVTVIPKRAGGFKIISEGLNMESAIEIYQDIKREIMNYK